jgi:ferredoxin
MRVAIDSSRCTGHGLCYVHAPTVFTDDDHGYGRVVGDGVVPDGDLDAVRHALANCPEGAISELQ